MFKRKKMTRAVGSLEGEVEVVELCWEQGRGVKVRLSKTSCTVVAQQHPGCSLVSPGHPRLLHAHPTPQVASRRYGLGVML